MKITSVETLQQVQPVYRAQPLWLHKVSDIPQTVYCCCCIDHR